MGACSSIIRPKNNALEVVSAICTYPRSSVINIVKRNEKHEIVHSDRYEFILSDPCQSYIETLNIFSDPVHISQCTLSGFDPRGSLYKKCQDACLVQHNDSSIFIALFDGHGSEGEKVAFFCMAFAEKFYKSNDFLIKSDETTKFLINLTESCEFELRSSSRINSSLSGCTAVFIVITSSNIYTASVGDSRAIIAKNTPSKDLVSSPVVEPSQVVRDFKKSRPSELVSNIFAIQLTKDQKPEDPEELSRLIESGARVKRLVDENGDRVGPYRVWEMNSNIPGLSMSRSIGDQIAKNLGVIATPVTTELKIETLQDLFIVVASDGVWDTMDNHDVCNYVEYFRTKCLREQRKIPKGEPISFKNANIAHMLCEEARTRWLSIVEEEDVIVDDISCVIIEINPGDHRAILNQTKAKVIKVNQDSDPQAFIRAPSMKEVKVKDPRRGTVIDAVIN